MFLETLCRFIEEHKVYIEDWIFILLLKLLHKQGTDMLKSVQCKLQLALEHIRYSVQCTYTCCVVHRATRNDFY